MRDGDKRFDSIKNGVNELVKESYENSQLKGWYSEGEFNIPEKLMLIVSEVSEALESYREHKKFEEETGYSLTDTFFIGKDGDLISEPYYYGIDDGFYKNPLGRNKVAGFPSELADIIIRVADLAGKMGINLGEVLELKLHYNRERPYRHGNKVC